MRLHRHAQDPGGRAAASTNPDAAGDLFHAAIWFILGACIFDLLDGRLARLGGHESAFGREFDSLADIVSFGVAPALMVYRIVLQEFPRACWMIAFIYLACGALRLARFNVVSGQSRHERTQCGKKFHRLSDSRCRRAHRVDHALSALARRRRTSSRQMEIRSAAAHAFLSFMMFSRFQYPSFKALNWKTKKSIPRFLVISVILIFTVMNYEWMPAVLFLSYLLYGFLRPWLSREWRREIEEEIGEEIGEEGP